jgi:hypothetical protein
VQHREGIYWCPASLRDEDQRSYKVRDVADVQAVPPPPVDEYESDSAVGIDSESPATSRRAPTRVVTSRRTRQTAGKIPASQAMAQIVEAKKRGEADQVRGVGGHHHDEFRRQSYRH